MQRLHYQPPGTAPAALELPPGQVGRTPQIRLMEYNAHYLDDRAVERVSDLPDNPDGERVHWINVGGLGDLAVLREMGQRYHIHPLALEDVLDPSQRPKVDEYESQL